MTNIGQSIAAIVAAIIGVAVLAVILSNGANTVGVLGAFFNGVTNLLGTAISPITGQATNTSTAALGGGSWSSGNQQFGSLLGGSGYSGSGSGSGGFNVGSLLGGSGGGGSGGFDIGSLASEAGLVASFL